MPSFLDGVAAIHAPLPPGRRADGYTVHLSSSRISPGAGLGEHGWYGRWWWRVGRIMPNIPLAGVALRRVLTIVDRTAEGATELATALRIRPDDAAAMRTAPTGCGGATWTKSSVRRVHRIPRHQPGDRSDQRLPRRPYECPGTRRGRKADSAGRTQHQPGPARLSRAVPTAASLCRASAARGERVLVRCGRTLCGSAHLPPDARRSAPTAAAKRRCPWAEPRSAPVRTGPPPPRPRIDVLPGQRRCKRRTSSRR